MLSLWFTLLSKLFGDKSTGPQGIDLGDGILQLVISSMQQAVREADASGDMAEDEQVEQTDAIHQSFLENAISAADDASTQQVLEGVLQQLKGGASYHSLLPLLLQHANQCVSTQQLGQLALGLLNTLNPPSSSPAPAAVPNQNVQFLASHYHALLGYMGL